MQPLSYKLNVSPCFEFSLLFLKIFLFCAFFIGPWQNIQRIVPRHEGSLLKVCYQISFCMPLELCTCLTSSWSPINADWLTNEKLSQTEHILFILADNTWLFLSRNPGFLAGRSSGLSWKEVFCLTSTEGEAMTSCHVMSWHHVIWQSDLFKRLCGGCHFSLAGLHIE